MVKYKTENTKTLVPSTTSDLNSIVIFLSLELLTSKRADTYHVLSHDDQRSKTFKYVEYPEEFDEIESQRCGIEHPGPHEMTSMQRPPEYERYDEKRCDKHLEIVPFAAPFFSKMVFPENLSLITE